MKAVTTSENWHVFREIYFKIILSILIGIAAMLILQNSLNQLKLRALVAEATSSRLQITAATIEASVVKAEALGLAMDEMIGLNDLLTRERARDASIEHIIIVSPIGTPIVSAGAADLPLADKDMVLRRILGGGEKMTLYDAGARLYTGRVLRDSSDAVMGAVIVTTQTQTYLSRARAAFAQMTTSYMMIFAAVAALIVPFIFYLFSGVRHAFRAFDDTPAKAAADDLNPSADTADLRKAMAASQAGYNAVAREVDDILIGQGAQSGPVSAGGTSL
ncbi:MAG: hypothetical protein ACK4SS_09360 [Cypionkella sp.]